MQLIKINNDAIKTTNKYRKLYSQNIFDEEICNLLRTIDKIWRKIQTIKNNESTILEKFFNIDKTLKQCCNNINEKLKEIQDDEFYNL